MSARETQDESTRVVGRCPAPPPSSGHQDLRLGLMDAGRRLRATLDDVDQFPDARDDLARFCFDELLPHLEADETWLLEAQRCPEGQLLATAIRTEARAITGAVHELVGATNPCEAVAGTRVLHALLAAHAHHEDLLATAAVAG